MQRSLQRDDDAQAEKSVCCADADFAVVFRDGAANVSETEAVEKIVVLAGAFWQRRAGAAVFAADHEHVVAGVGLEGDEPLVWRQFFSRLDGIIEGVAENRAEIEGRDECAVGEMNDGVEIDLLFPRLARFVTQDDVEGVVACVMIILVACDLRAQFVRSVLRRAISLLKQQQMVLRSW